MVVLDFTRENVNFKLLLMSVWFFNEKEDVKINTRFFEEIKSFIKLLFFEKIIQKLISVNRRTE